MHNIPTTLYSEIHEIMPIICVDCVISVDNKILLVKRKCEPMSGAWWFPGGRLTKNERLNTAMSRIVKSETGLDLSRPVMLGHDETKFEADPFGHGAGTHTVNFVYASRVSEMAMMRMALDSNHIECSTFSFEEIYQSDMHSYIKKFTALSEGVFNNSAVF